MFEYTNTDLFDYFANGSEYDMDGGTIDEPRKKCCESCAFGSNPKTVRPADVSLEELIKHAEQFDVFYCHTQMQDGKYRICAKWYAIHEDNLLNHFKHKQEIEKSLTRKANEQC